MIEVEQLTKFYGERAAISGLSFRIAQGEVIGFLGLNGAGKTTTLKVLGCVLLPTSGRVRIDGFDVVGDPHEIRRRIGFLPDTPPLYEEMTVGAFLAFVAKLRGVPASEVAAKVRLAEEKTALLGVDAEVIGSLSHGFRQRVGVAQALVHQPRLLILDEPTSGLDPKQIVEMRAVIRSLKGSHTVLVSSHILSEISQVCDRILVIQNGQIVAQGTEEELAARFGSGKGVAIEARGAQEAALSALRAVQGVGAVNVDREENGVLHLRVDGSSELRPALVRALVAAQIDVMRVDVRAEALEEIFLKVTGGEAS